MKGEFMNENQTIILTIYKESEMASYTLKQLLEALEEKGNKTKMTIQHILEGYERYQKEAKKEIESLGLQKEKEGFLTKMTAKMGIQKEVKKDNSDSAIAEMLIEGIVMGSTKMEQKIKQYETSLDKKYLKLAQDFLTFQQENIESLKKEL